MTITLTLERATDYSVDLALLENIGVSKTLIYNAINYYFNKWFNSVPQTDDQLEQLFSHVDQLTPYVYDGLRSRSISIPSLKDSKESALLFARCLIAIHDFYRKIVKTLRTSAQYAHQAIYGYPHFTPVCVFEVRMSGWYLSIQTL